MARAIAIRAIGDRSAGLRAANKRAATRPESGIAAQSASLAITSGAGLPKLDTATLTVVFASALPAGGGFTPTGFTLYAANRKWKFTSASASKSSATLTMTGVAVSTATDSANGDTIIGNGNLTVGTPTAYATTDNKLTYDGSDSTNLAGVASISNLSVTLTGDAVPVVTKLEWTAGGWDTTIIFSANIDAFDDVPSMSGAASGLAWIPGANLFAAGGTNTTAILDQPNTTSVFTGTSGLSDRIVESGTGLTASAVSVPAFTFPLYIVGGALCKPSSASQTGTTVTVNFSRSVATGSTDIETAWTTRKTNTGYEGSSGSFSGSSLTLTVISSGANVGADVLNYTGIDTGANDGAGRPIPPITNFTLS